MVANRLFEQRFMNSGGMGGFVGSVGGICEL